MKPTPAPAASRRELPPLPNLARLKKEAKARLAAMRERLPAAQLSEAQFLLAREYGFVSWTALKAEVELRAASPGAGEIRKQQARGALHRAMTRNQPVEEGDPHAPAHFLRLGVLTAVFILLVAMAGLAIVFAGSKGGAQQFLTLLRGLFAK